MEHEKQTLVSSLSKSCPMFSEEEEDLKLSLAAQKVNQPWFDDKLDPAGNLRPTRDLIQKYSQGDYGLDWSSLDSEAGCSSMQELGIHLEIGKGRGYT